MMFITIVLFTVFLQLLGYWAIDAKKPGFNKLWLLLVILLFYFLPLPYILCAIAFGSEEGEPRCGLPVLGIIGACWIFGGAIAIITHLLYYGVKKLLV
jgi:hypothetical protein